MVPRASPLWSVPAWGAGPGTRLCREGRQAWAQWDVVLESLVCVYSALVLPLTQ